MVSEANQQDGNENTCPNEEDNKNVYEIYLGMIINCKSNNVHYLMSIILTNSYLDNFVLENSLLHRSLFDPLLNKLNLGLNFCIISKYTT